VLIRVIRGQKLCELCASFAFPRQLAGRLPTGAAALRLKNYSVGQMNFEFI
jgi:hypothetical protein